MNTQEVQKAFCADLKALLSKWDAEISLVDVGRGEMVDEEISVLVRGIYKGSETVRPFTEFNLGKWFP